MAPSGMEMMAKSLIKMLGLDPAVIQGMVAEIGKSLHTVATNAEIIRRQNQAIMAHLGISDVVSTGLTLTEGQDNAGDTERKLNGHG